MASFELYNSDVGGQWTSSTSLLDLRFHASVMPLHVDTQADLCAEKPSSDAPIRSLSVSDSIAMKEGEQVAEEIIGIHNELVAMADLRPSKEVNSLFNRLVEVCVRPRNDQVASTVLENKQIIALSPRLRQLCSDGEAELERFWANIILKPNDVSVERAQISVHSFPYYSNYVDLCRLECSTLLGVSPADPQSIAFIGSGPLPLSSFCLADRFPSARIHNIDHDLTAIRVSSALALQLGYGERISFSHEMAIGGGSLKSYDVVCLAALVGIDAKEKLRILADMTRRMRHGAIICMRSAHSLRGLMYPVIEFSEDLHRIGLEALAVVHPWNHIVNSILFMRVQQKIAGHDAIL